MVHTASQRYLSTRGGSYGLSFEDVVLKGLAADGGLFIPEEIPVLPNGWESKWKDLSFPDLAYEVLSLYISPDEIPSEDLKDIITRSYKTFRTPDVAPLTTLNEQKQLYLLELFHGPTYAFKDVALQFLGNLFEYFLVRRNKGKTGKDRDHLVIIGATSGDTGSAAIHGLRGKKDISIFILHPKGRVSPIQEAQMTTVLDANVHNLAVEGSFDTCQDIVKTLFADPNINSTHHLGAVNSINWARILAQITYYFHAYLQLTKLPSYKTGTPIRFIVPSGNFGDILAGYFATRMSLPATKLIIATNANDILHRFLQTGSYRKQAPPTDASLTVDSSGVIATYSPAMDILVSSNFERLLWILSFEDSAEGAGVESRRRAAGAQVKQWLNDLKTKNGFDVASSVTERARRVFESERVSDEETLATIKQVYETCHPHVGRAEGTTSTATGGYILDPHSAVGVTAALRSLSRNPTHSHISLSTAHPAKFSGPIGLALAEEHGFSFDDVVPAEFRALERMPKRVRVVAATEGWQGVGRVVEEEVAREKVAAPA